ncbi:hypothetical protein L917_10205 [Phytophthora nicotianae]|uniref:Uncharacterized protein n=1 Tax=Phytophthora nicotianae TaxID=4792 RepID=W2L1J5_PHYNI|nr:hypothetical protein L917_10205 [Phytophthora nicotianae]
MNYEFDFPDYSLDSNMSCSNDEELSWLDDALLDFVLKHQLREEEKQIADAQICIADTRRYDEDREDTSKTRSEEMCDSTDTVLSFLLHPPPPENVYDSHDAKKKAIHDWTLQHNYNVSRRRVRYLPGTKTS